MYINCTVEDGSVTEIDIELSNDIQTITATCHKTN